MGYTHGESWDCKKIELAIKDTMHALCINRMPTAAEIKAIRNDESLNNAISRSGGFKKWANRLEISQTKCETRFGNQYEEVAANMLVNRGYGVERTRSQSPYDLLVNSKIKVDVKAANPFILRGSRVHTVHLAKKFATCDIYMMFAIDEDGKTERLLIVPWAAMGNIVTVCIGLKSKYNIYDRDFSVFDTYSNFYSKVSNL